MFVEFLQERVATDQLDRPYRLLFFSFLSLEISLLFLARASWPSLSPLFHSSSSAAPRPDNRFPFARLTERETERNSLTNISKYYGWTSSSSFLCTAYNNEGMVGWWWWQGGGDITPQCVVYVHSLVFLHLVREARRNLHPRRTHGGGDNCIDRRHGNIVSTAFVCTQNNTRENNIPNFSNKNPINE